ncbi:MAG: M48 family metallopeptidase [Bacteroidales bacterium]|nr:M48 family metallopeptidase [Bacteroidales bacterium]
MKKTFLIVLLYSLSFSCTNAQSTADKLELDDDRVSTRVGQMTTDNPFDYSCLISDPYWFLAFNQWKAEEDLVDMSPFDVTLEEENEFGDKMFDEMKKSGDYTFIEDGDMLEGVKEIVDELLSARPSTNSGLTYTVHLIDDNATVNAFTAGGHIFVTTGIIDFCETTSELAVILAHEIGHNENGDIKRILIRAKGAGEFAEIAMLFKNLFTMSWNQFNEIRCDQYGIMLSSAAGYDACITPDLWEKIALEFQEQPDMFENLFRSHPYSEQRAECAQTFIDQNDICL